MELWDERNEQGDATGHLLRRGEPVPEGRYHLVVSIWVCDPFGRLLVTLRAPEKDSYPSSWENTAGSALAGESSREAALRELNEETGILADESALYLARRLRGRSAFIDTYFLRLTNVPDDVILQPGETAAYRWVTSAELDDMILTGQFAAPVVRRLAVLREPLNRFVRGE